MPFSRFGLLLCASILALPSLAAVAQQVTTYGSDDSRGFILVREKPISANGSWDNLSRLQTFAHTHPGHYILFEQNKVLYELDEPSALAEAERTYAPMASLEARQHELALQQKPLAEQQHALAAQQKAATGNPSEQLRIGAEQGRVGQLQGEIGRKQGAVGEQQGQIGRAFYKEVLSLIDTCLSQKTCHPVS